MTKKVEVPQSDLPVMPLNDMILVEVIKEEKSAGGLELPTKNIISGFVCEVGPGVDKVKYPVEKGQKVYFPRGTQSGYPFGKDYLLLTVSHCLGILR